MVRIVLAYGRRRSRKVFHRDNADKLVLYRNRDVVADLEALFREEVFYRRPCRIALRLCARGIKKPPRARRAAVAPFPREFVVDEVPKHLRVVTVRGTRLGRRTVAPFCEVGVEHVRERRAGRVEVLGEIVLVVLFVVGRGGISKRKKHRAAKPETLQVRIVASCAKRVEAPATKPLDRVACPGGARDELLDVRLAVAHAVVLLLAAEAVELYVVDAKPYGRKPVGIRQPPRVRTVLRDAVEAGIVVLDDDLSAALQLCNRIEVSAEALAVDKRAPASVVRLRYAVVEDVGPCRAGTAKILHDRGDAVAVVGAEIVARNFCQTQSEFAADALYRLVLLAKRREQKARRDACLRLDPVRRLRNLAADFVFAP